MAEERPGAVDYEALYRQYEPRVRALARRKLQGRHVSEDVVQEVFIRAFRALPDLDLDRPLWPWLQRVCVNVCTDVLRSPRTWAEEPVDQVPEGLAEPGVDPVSLVVAAEQRQAINEALDALPARQREVLLRRVLDGATSEAMAASEGTTVEAVKSAVKRSRHTFRKAYTDIAGERGLLGAPALADRLRGVGPRLRAAYDACLRVCNNPWWQTAPVAAAAAVLLLGGGLGFVGSGEAAEAEGPSSWGRDEYLRTAAGALVASAARSSTGATGPGGGVPPSSPPGHQPPGPAADPLIQTRVGGTVTDPEKGNIHISTHEVYPEQADLGYGNEGQTGIWLEMGCKDGPVREAACGALQSHWPSVSHEFAYWGP